LGILEELRATRKPRMLNRIDGTILNRFADRQSAAP
jgi:hypothetical protein